MSSLFHFGPCELDEARRSLTAHGRELKLQPRVFDLLCYLVRHRERVVPKDELLDALWPGSVVVDNAVQRVVSLARGALAEVGVGEAVRTYPRHGYRFCVEACEGACEQAQQAAAQLPGSSAAAEFASASPAAAAPGTSDELRELRAAQAAIELSDWPGACTAYAAADAQAPLGRDDVEAWGRAAICAGLGPSVVAALEHSVAQCDAAGDALGAARAILLLVQIRIDYKEPVLARGLLHRVARYLEGQPAGVERGHFAWMASRMAIGAGNANEALAMADEACILGRRLRDADIECLGLTYRGHALMAQGDLAGALAHHEEAAAVVRLGGVRSWVAGWALCSILYAARHRCDWLRAAQFADAYSAWSRASRMSSFPGTCQLHRAVVLGVQGDMAQATAEANAAASLLAHAAPWAEGDAWCVLGDLRLSSGDLPGAEAAFKQAYALGWDPQPGLARLHLQRGQSALARRELERALEETDWTLRERRGQILCLLVHAALASGDLARAQEALRILGTDPQMLGTDALKALHAQARAELALHEHGPAHAAPLLRRSIRHWREVRSPLGEAEARLRLAECLLDDGDAAAAELELHAIGGALASAPQHAARLAALRGVLQPQVS